MNFEVQKLGQRWHLFVLFPDPRLVRKFPTKRAALAVQKVIQVRSAESSRAECERFLADEMASAKRSGMSELESAKFAVQSLILLMRDWGIPEPTWWRDVYHGMLDENT